jgi:excinuclease ABC subunit C
LTTEQIIAQNREKAMHLPLSPGVYIMHNKHDEIIYIGKAKALRNRVSQYFGSQNTHPEKVRKMVQNAAYFEYILTGSEYEALVLECSLIKQHMPKYNILLKDEKGYHYVKISKEPYPLISAENKVNEDGALYLGPYVSSYAVRQAVDEVQKAFKLHNCKRHFPQDFKKGRPCLNFHINQCMAPCRGCIPQELYTGLVNEAVRFLKGGSADLLKSLEAQMLAASERLEFEQAARIRDRIKAIKKISERQKVVMAKIEEQDIIALAQSTNGVCFEVFRFQGGRLCDRESFLLSEIDEKPCARREFIRSYYQMRSPVPPRIALDGEVEDKELLSRWLGELSGRRVEISIPQKGEQAKLVEMCRENAAEHLAHARSETGKNIEALDELGEALGIAPPEYIESYDISNTAGSENVAGMVVFENGKPLKSAYRRFKIKGFEGQDDYASMREVITRRLDEYEKNKESGKGFGRLPDLILLDGGKGHVAAIAPILKGRGCEIPLFGMVKDSKHKTRAIALEGGEIAISNKRKVFTLVASIQEEVHRFAIAYHRQRRSSTTISTTLRNIEGIGEARASALLKHFKTIAKIKAATVEELASVKSMTEVAAQKVFDFYAGER